MCDCTAIVFFSVFKVCLLCLVCCIRCWFVLCAAAVDVLWCLLLALIGLLLFVAISCDCCCW